MNKSKKAPPRLVLDKSTPVPIPVPLDEQLRQAEWTIKWHEVEIAKFRQKQAELKKKLNPEKLWQCRFCPARIPYSEVYKHTQEHFESEVILD
jgi:hypothetical protein